MNLFGFTISWNGKGNENIKRKECHQAQDTLRTCFITKIDKLRDDLKFDATGVHKRIDEIFKILIKK